MKISRFEIIVFTIASVISILTFFLPLAPACAATIAPPCSPIYFQNKLPLLASSISTVIIFGIAFFIVSFNRVRREIGEFGGWRKVFLKITVSWIAGAIFTGVLILIFWNQSAAIYSLFIGPPLAIIFSSYFLAKNKPILFTLLSATTLITILVFIVVLFFLIAALLPDRPKSYLPTF